MPTTRSAGKKNLPGRFEDLVRLMPPQAIVDDAHYENTVEMIDTLMACGRLTRDQHVGCVLCTHLDSPAPSA